MQMLESELAFQSVFHGEAAEVRGSRMLTASLQQSFIFTEGLR